MYYAPDIALRALIAGEHDAARRRAATERLARQARARALERFTQEAIARQTYQIYQDILGHVE